MKKLLLTIGLMVGLSLPVVAENNWKMVPLLTNQVAQATLFTNLSTNLAPIEIPGLLLSDVTFIPYLVGTNAATTNAITFALLLGHEPNRMTLLTNATTYFNVTPNATTPVRPYVRVDKTNFDGFRYFKLMGITNVNAHRVVVSNLTVQFLYSPSSR